MTALDPYLPGLTDVRSRVTRGRVAKALVARAVRDLPVRVRYPGGEVLGGGDATSPVLEVLDPDRLHRRLEAHPKIGLGEGYMAGEWRAEVGSDLADALTPFAARLATILPRPLLRLRGLVDVALPHRDRNTREGSRANIAAHCDLSNDLFATFLDETMTYSSALFDESRPWAEQTLREAQSRKIEAALDAAGVGSGTKMLEIGTGWGALAMVAAARGARVTTITLSGEQHAEAVRRVADAGLTDRVEVRVQDYREVEGQFDVIVSIEMLEAVGDEYWPTYLKAIDRLLAPGGSAIVQSILMEHERYLATRNSYGWIQKYIFPGGLIPSLDALSSIAQQHTTLTVTAVRPFGLHYAETLRRWRHEFDRQWPSVKTLGFDETFRRMWEFYLAYSEAGFRSAYLDVAQLTFERHS